MPCPIRSAKSVASRITQMCRRILVICLGLIVLLTSCAEDDRRELRLTRTSTATAGVRVLADNCPGPTNVALLVRDNVLWEVQAPVEPPEAEQNSAGEDGSVEAEPTIEPGLVEILVGETPQDWATIVPLTETIEPGIRYTIRTLPDGQTIDFSEPDLQPGLLWDGTGVIQFNPDLANVECSDPIDAGIFARNVAVLGAFGATAAAIVLVSLILILFVITRRFSRVRSLQQQARREAEGTVS